MGASSGLPASSSRQRRQMGSYGLSWISQPRKIRHLRIEQRGERAQDAALGLATQSQQDEIVARKNGVDNLRHHGVVVTDDAGKDRAAAAQPGDEVVAHFVFDTAVAHALFGKLLAATKLGQSLRKIAQGLDTSQGHGRTLPTADMTITNVRILRLCDHTAGDGNHRRQWQREKKSVVH